MQEYITTKDGRKIPLNSAAEDAIITQQSIEDDTNWTDEELKQFKPLSEYPELQKRIGRPKSDNHKVRVNIRLSSEIVDFFKATGKGWQTRLNDVLNEYVSTH